MDIKGCYAQLDRAINSGSSQRKQKRCPNDYFKQRNLDFSLIHLTSRYTTEWVLIGMVSLFTAASEELTLLRVGFIWWFDVFLGLYKLHQNWLNVYC